MTGGGSGLPFNFDSTWESLRKRYSLIAGFHPRGLDWTGLGCTLGTRSAKSSPGDSNVQLRLSTPALGFAMERSKSVGGLQPQSH